MALLDDLVARVASTGPDTGAERFSYIDLGSVDSKLKQISSPSSVATGEAPSRARQRLQSGDVLVSTVRPNLNGVATVTSEFDGYIASTGFCVLRPNMQKLDSAYLFHWVRSPQFISEMNRRATGASYPAVSDKIVKSSEIPLPPLPEQRRIAAILGQADELRTKRRRALTLLDELAEAIFDEMFGLATNSNAGRTVALAERAHRVTDGTHQAPNWADEGIPFLFTSNITSGSIDYSTTKYVSVDTYRSLTRRAPIEIGDVLYSAVGSYGNVVVVDDEAPFIFQRHIAQIKPRLDLVDPYFLRGALRSPEVRRQADKVARGVAQKTVTLGEISKFQIPEVQMSEQRVYRNRIQQLESSANAVRKSESELDTLFASLQHRAFRGEL